MVVIRASRKKIYIYIGGDRERERDIILVEGKECLCWNLISIAHYI